MTPKGASRHVLAACVAVAVLLGLGGVTVAKSCQGGKVEQRSARRGPERQEPPSRGPRPSKRDPRPVEDGGPRLARVSLARLDVTEGELRPGTDDELTVDGPRMRAVVPGTHAASAELRFKVLGPTSEQRALASGEQRQQVGLKLRALDGCNLVYVMWRIAPKPGIVVNYKRNPGQHTSRECGNGGYTTVRPKRRASVEAPAPGTSHTLRARLDGSTLRVWADGSLAWEGDLPAEALAIDGPVGLRSDNVRVALQLYSPLP